MNVKISVFQSSLKHSPALSDETARFLQEIEARLNTNLRFSPLNDYARKDFF